MYVSVFDLRHSIENHQEFQVSASRTNAWPNYKKDIIIHTVISSKLVSHLIFITIRFDNKKCVSWSSIYVSIFFKTTWLIMLHLGPFNSFMMSMWTCSLVMTPSFHGSLRAWFRLWIGFQPWGLSVVCVEKLSKKKVELYL